jgi:hypothetical protein
MRPAARRRLKWSLVVLGCGAIHLIVHRLLGLGTFGQLAWTDGTVTVASMLTAVACIRTVRSCKEPHLRRAWIAITVGVASWVIAAIGWDIRELGLGEVAPEPSWLDTPFFAMAPCFAVALVFYRRREPSRAFQLKQIADLGIVSATMLIVGTLLFAGPIAKHGYTPYMIVALGYPFIYLSLVIVALGVLGHRHWGPRRVVLGVLVWSQLAFAAVDLMYGASSLDSNFQTTGLEDTLWLAGLLSVWWSTVEERALLAEGNAGVHDVESTSWNAVVVAVALIALVGFLIQSSVHVHGWPWVVLGIAALAAVGFVALRMWAAEQLENAYRDALAESDAKSRALDVERGSATRWRSVGTVVGGTAHEVSNLLQAIVTNLELLRRRIARGENVDENMVAMDGALWRARDELQMLRSLTPADVGARGTVLLLASGDLDGKVSVALSEAGYATAVLPTVEAVIRATKGLPVRAIVAAPSELVAIVAALEARGQHIAVVPTMRPSTTVAGVDVARLVKEIEAATRDTAASPLH